MPETACPACGETEALQGRPTGEDIAITCGQCGAEWMRGEPRCKQCGRTGGVSAPQRMTRHPRGTLLAVVGVRQVPLCSTCDSEVLTAAMQRHQPVPEGYVSRFLFGAIEERPAEPPRPKASPHSHRRAADTVSRTVRPAPTTPAPSTAPPQTRASSRPADPTVRQATEAFLNEAGSSSDGLTMVLLGTKIGAATRLSRIDTPETAGELARWVGETFGTRSEQREQAVDVLRRATTYWTAQGWLKLDLTAELQ